MAEMKTTKTVKFGKYEAEVIRSGFEAERFHGSFITILRTELQSGSFAEDTKPLIAFIESWTAPGDFHDLDSWKTLDWFTEYGPLRKAILDTVNEYIATRANLPN